MGCWCVSGSYPVPAIFKGRKGTKWIQPRLCGRSIPLAKVSSLGLGLLPSSVAGLNSCSLSPLSAQTLLARSLKPCLIFLKEQTKLADCASWTYWGLRPSLPKVLQPWGYSQEKHRMYSQEGQGVDIELIWFLSLRSLWSC